MNKLKKVGLTALAGSLVATSAMADMSVSGSSSIGLTSISETYPDSAATALANTSGNGFTMGNSVTFSASGEMDNGMTVSTSFELDQGAMDGGPFDSHSISIDMNEMGKITFSGHGGSTAVGKYDDMTPNAYEEVWDVLDNNGAAADDGGGNDMWQYSNTFADSISVFASYYNQESGVVESYSDFGVTYTGVEGLTIGYAEGENKQTSAAFDEQETMFITYAYGPLTVGYQTAESDVQGGVTSDADTLAYSASYAVSDDLSVSYGIHEYEYGNTSLVDQESSGFSVSYTMGSMTFGGAFNSTDNVAGNSSNDEEGYEVSVSFAF